MEVNGTNAQTVHAVHLISGITVLGRVTVANDDGVVMLKPMALMTQQGQQPGQVAVSMIPYLSIGVFPPLDELFIPEEAIILMREAPAKIEAAYIELTSGIAIAPANGKF